MRKPLSFALPALLVALAVLLPFAGKMLPSIAGPYPLSIARSVFTYMALAISWDMLLRSGQISFGIAGFFGIGIYGAALSVLRLGFPPVASILFAGLFAALVAFLLGFVILRLRAVYFSITTLALAEIFRVILHNGGDFTGGAEGVVLPGVMFKGDAKALYWLGLFAVLLALGLSSFFQRSKIRFALTAIRNDEVSAKSSGIHIFKYLMIAFVTTSFIQGIVGGVNLQGYGYASPDTSFDANYTLLPLAMALLGGIHGTAGPVIGAVLLGLASEFLKLRIPYGHLVVYGIIIVLVILFMPKGLYGLWQSRAKAAPARRADGSAPDAGEPAEEAGHA